MHPTQPVEIFDNIAENVALLNTLMKRLLPVKLLSLLENCLLNFHSCVKRESRFSQFFKLEFGVRLGSVSPFSIVVCSALTILLNPVIAHVEFAQ